MTEREFDERLRREYRAAASSWTPDAKTKNALLDTLERSAAPRRSAARVLRPAMAVCCCALIAAAAFFVLREQPQAENVAVTAMMAQDESSEAAVFAAPAQGDAVSGEAEAANDAAAMEKAQDAQPREAENGILAFSGDAEAASAARLTQEEIDALREQYPIADPAAAAVISMVPPSLSDVMELADTFVYGEVVGVETVEKVLSTGDESLDAKQQGAGEVSFQVLTLRVIEDTAGVFGEGEEISLWTNAALAEYGPQLTEGMRAVLPAVAHDSEGRYDTCCIGTYYVTPEGFVLSAFDEEQCGGSWSGALVEELLTGLKG